jgi:hypothetical protein
MTVTSTFDAFSPARFQTMCQMAEVFIRSRMLPPSIQTPDQAIVIMVKGQELGLQPLQAVNGINVIQGKPTVSPQLMLSLINRSGKLEDIKFEIGADYVACTMKRWDRTPHTERFGAKEAQLMGLISKDNYKRQPLVMYKWRAVAACARTIFPDVIDGLYTPEEMGADVVVDDEGNMEIKQPSATEKTLSPEAAQRLTAALIKFGVEDAAKLATSVLGREVTELTTLTKTEGTQVFDHAKATFEAAQKALEAQQAETSPEPTPAASGKTSKLIGTIMGHLTGRFGFPKEENTAARADRLSFMAFLAEHETDEGITSSKNFDEGDLQKIIAALAKERQPQNLLTAWKAWKGEETTEGLPV